MELYDVVIVGGGPGGLSAAYSAYRNGAKKILVIERDRELGGILQQCIHNGFGLHHFKEELTGPGYAGRCIEPGGYVDSNWKLEKTASFLHFPVSESVSS